MKTVRTRRAGWFWLLTTVVVTSQALGQSARPAPNDSSTSDAVRVLTDRVKDSTSPLSFRERAMAEMIQDRVATTEWLGALAPVALSPFFGLTCLSGVSVLGEEWLPDNHFLRRVSSPLRNPVVFFVLFALTLITSIPKFSKVSKPFAQAVDQLEAYAGIIILLVIRYVGGTTSSGEPGVAVVLQAGMLSFSAESLLWIATAVNIIVINSVKFFFEVLVWITPIPLIDAVFEATNKLVCAGLVGLYAFSPTLATILNLILLAACLVAFCWVKRREVYYRTILFDFLRGLLNRQPKLSADGKLTAFPKRALGNIRALSRGQLWSTGEGWTFEVRRFLRAPLVQSWSRTESTATMNSGLLSNTLSIGDNEFKFGRRYQGVLRELSRQLCADLGSSDTSKGTGGELATELV